MIKDSDVNYDDWNSADEPKVVYKLRLFITGASPNSMRAVTNTKKICEQFLKDRYELEIIDVYQQAELIKHEQIIALPLLKKDYPLPQKKLIGDMSDVKNVLKGLGIE